MYRLIMSTSIVCTEKRSRGRPKTDATSIHLTLVPETLGALDAYIAAQPDPKPSRPEAIRALMREGLAAAGMRTPVGAELTREIEALEDKVASIPAIRRRSPEAGVNTMRKALAEDESAVLKNERERTED